MKNYLKHIDDFFREKLGRYRETPPPDVWEALDKQLDGLVPSAPKPSFRWAGHIAMVSLVAVLSIPVVKKILGNRGNMKTTPTEVAATTTNAPANVQTASAANENSVSQANSEAAQKTPGAAENAAIAPGKEAAAKQNSESGGTEERQAASRNTTVNDELIAQANHKGSKEKRKEAHEKHNANKIAQAERKGAGKQRANKDKKKANTGSEQAEKVNTYGGSTINNLEAAPQKETAVSTPQQPVAKTEKKEAAKAKTAQKELVEKPTKPMYSKVELGLKAGYERGVDKNASSKYVVSPYLQYNLSPKVAIMTQPGIKYARQSTHSIGDKQTYYNVIEGGQTKQNGSSTPNVAIRGGTADTISYTTKYTYSTTYDSIVKSYTAGGAYLEVELPLLLKYSISNKLSVYGGANFTYSKLTGIKEHTYTKRVTSSVDFSETTQTLPVTTPVGPGVNYTGSPLSGYNGPAYHAATDGRLNMGYMLGVSYEFTHRWLFDALMEHSAVNRAVTGGYDVNAPLSAVYFRLSAGYKFIK